MARGLVLVSVLFGLVLAGCVREEAAPLPVEPLPDDVLTTSTRLVLVEPGWARFEIAPAEDGQVLVWLEEPEGVDLCEPFRGKREGNAPGDFVAYALMKTTQPADAQWFLLFGEPWGGTQTAGDPPCGKTILSLQADERAALVVATNMTGMAIDVMLADADPQRNEQVPDLVDHPALRVLRPEGERQGTADTGPLVVDAQSRWTTETSGGRRIVHARAWEWGAGGPDPAIVDLGSETHHFSLTGLLEPARPTTTGSIGGFRSGGISYGATTASGYAAGDQIVAATSERDTAIWISNDERHAGLTVYEIPLEAPPRPKD